MPYKTYDDLCAVHAMPRLRGLWRWTSKPVRMVSQPLRELCDTRRRICGDHTVYVSDAASPATIDALGEANGDVCFVRTTRMGAMRVDDLMARVDTRSAATIVTSTPSRTGAWDDVPTIKRAVRNLCAKNTHVHADLGSHAVFPLAVDMAVEADSFHALGTSWGCPTREGVLVGLDVDPTWVEPRFVRAINENDLDERCADRLRLARVLFDELFPARITSCVLQGSDVILVERDDEIVMRYKLQTHGEYMCVRADEFTPTTEIVSALIRS